MGGRRIRHIGLLGLLGTTALVATPTSRVFAVGDISGTVTNDFGEAVVGAEVRICGPAGCDEYATDASGNFSVAAQPDGDYTIQFTDATGAFGRHVPEWYDDQPEAGDATVLTIPTDTTTGLTIELLRNPILTGNVVDDIDAPIEGIEVTACRPTEFGTTCRVGITDASGDYSIQLERFDYDEVSFTDPTGAHEREYWAGPGVPGVVDREEAVAIQVADGTDAVADGELFRLASISGTVQDDFGAPVQFAIVSADSTTSGTGGDTRTDADGNFTVYTAPGTYRLQVGKAAFVNEYWEDTTFSGADLITLNSREDVVLPRPISITELAIISGTVTLDDGGEPVSRVGVFVCTDPCTSSVGSSTSTSSSGRYELWVPPGDYLLRFDGTSAGVASEYWDDAASIGDATMVTAAIGAPIVRDASLGSGGTISGCITEVDGDPVVGIQLRFSGLPGGGVRTDSEGCYTNEVPAGSYDLTIIPGFTDYIAPNSPTTIDVEPGEIVGDVDFTLSQFARLTGVVTDDDDPDRPLEGVTASLSGLGGAIGAGSTTDENGQYSLRAVPGEDYVLRFRSLAFQNEFFDNVTDGTPTVLTFADGEQRTIDVGLDSGGVITGTVTAAGGGPIENIVVAIGTVGTARMERRTDENGIYRFGGVESGDYNVWFSDPFGEVYATVYHDDRNALTRADPVTVDFDGPAVVIDAELTVASSITGQVKVNGTPTDSVGIQVCRTGPLACTGNASIGADGRYVVDDLLPGDYVVQFRGPPGVASAWWEERPGPDAATPISLTAGQVRTNVDGDLGPGGSIMGVITDADGDPIRNVYIEVCRRAATSSAGCFFALSDASGTYEVVDVFPANDYVVSFDSNLLNPEPARPIEFYCDAESEADALGVSVRAGETTTDIDASLRESSSPDHDTCDADGDGILDPLDNCPGSANADQTDLDDDGLGDACDTDVDDDNVPDQFDNCVRDPNGRQQDVDADGKGDACDPTDDRDVFTSLPPERYADSRNEPTFDRLFRDTGPRPGGSEWEIDIAGRGGVPADATAVIINLTVLNGVAPGYATVHPCLPAVPNASSVNYAPGQIEPNEIVAKLSPRGTLCVFTQSTADVIVDVVGALVDSPLVPLSPTRYGDSRDEPTFDRQFRNTGMRRAGTVWTIPVAGRGDVPTDAVAAVVNLTVTGGTGPGFATVFPCGPKPDTSSLNYDVGVTRPNELITKLSSSGEICVFVLTDVHVIVDVVGFLEEVPGYEAITPVRYADSRNEPTFDRQFRNTGIRRAGTVWTIPVAGRGGIPASATSVVANLTVTGAADPGFATVFDCTTRPGTSSVNYGPGVTRPNEVIAQLSADGELCVYVLSDVDVIVDIVGHT